MENKIFCKTISVDRVFCGFDPEIGLHFYFHYKPFSNSSNTQRERERERGKKLAHSTLIHPHRSMHRRDRATNPPTDRPTLSIDEIAPRTHELIDPPSEWPTPRSTHLVHWRVAPTNRSFSVPLSQYRSCDFDFCFLCCLYILFLCNNICLDPKKMWETW